jgi:hypothetical protein
VIVYRGFCILTGQVVSLHETGSQLGAALDGACLQTSSLDLLGAVAEVPLGELQGLTASKLLSSMVMARVCGHERGSQSTDDGGCEMHLDLKKLNLSINGDVSEAWRQEDGSDVSGLARMKNQTFPARPWQGLISTCAFNLLTSKSSLPSHFRGSRLPVNKTQREPPSRRQHIPAKTPILE